MRLPLMKVPLVLLASMTTKLLPLLTMRTCCLLTLLLGSTMSLPCTRPTVISGWSNLRTVGLPPFSVIVTVTMAYPAV